MSDEGVTNLAQLTDDQLREALFHRLVARLEAERATDPRLLVACRAPYVSSLSRHGHVLRVDQGHHGRLMRIEVMWPHTPGRTGQDTPWTASVIRSADGARLRLSGGSEGTIEAMVDTIVDTFLYPTGPDRAA